ncbi:MAG: hypothetical protein DI551_04090 [Micavibrio aeruginosavorus]|uniref:Pilus assembly protein CpaD n=1 Tax=Micavibrio aeruginosavorus TaxID=349221 RepID=A0A2W5N3K2_9BACT|nr:MAG: hypothetical protein DI551_04090 [Micavibrio aeruginosavorus]
MSMKKHTALMMVLISACALSACARQNTPSMMSTNKPQVLPETTLQQVPAKSVSDGYLMKIADDYARFGADTLQLGLVYDPNVKGYGAMQAFNDLARFKEKLSKLGVRSIKAETIKQEGGEPTLLITYDSLHAAAPQDCGTMAGIETRVTNHEDIADYKFGCSVDTMLARQIYRPSDLLGNSASDPGDGRRAANSVEYYRTISPEEAEGDLQRIQREDIEN